MRAWGWSPNETFETPRLAKTPGSASLMARIPSIVSTAEARNSSSPVASVKVSASKISAPGSSPYASTQISWMRRATSSFRSAVFAIPDSSMVSATSAAPCSSASGSTASIRSRPASRLIELITARPGFTFSAASTTSTSVVSITSGVATLCASSLTSVRVCSASSERSVSAVQTSSRWAPLSTCSRATSRMSS